ncbi:MAG: hypothetical protein KF779_11825 [Hyphomonadaceae bacterium]|nr:hypothetical protein [Hyphomonadaceae bacterium]
MNALSSKLIRDGLAYSAILAGVAITPGILGVDDLPCRAVDWSIVALLAVCGGFALSTLIWFADRRIPQRRRQQLRKMTVWLILSGTLFLVFYVMWGG